MAEVCRTAVPVSLHQQPIMQVLAWAFHRSKRAGRCCCEERSFERHGADGKRSCSSCAGAPHGLYQIAVWLGNTQHTSITTENMLQILNATKNNVYHILQVFAKDGQLNLAACAGKGETGPHLCPLEIEQIHIQATANPTICICGDSKVRNRSPLDASEQVVWGQTLPEIY